MKNYNDIVFKLKNYNKITKKLKKFNKSIYQTIIIIIFFCVKKVQSLCLFRVLGKISGKVRDNNHNNNTSKYLITQIEE